MLTEIVFAELLVVKFFCRKLFKTYRVVFHIQAQVRLKYHTQNPSCGTLPAITLDLTYPNNYDLMCRDKKFINYVDQRKDNK